MNRMNVLFVGLFAVGGLVTLTMAGSEEKLTVNTAPPVVIRTVPVSGDTRVVASTTKEIRVTFSKPMRDGNWSWVTASDDTTLPIKGKPRFDKDGKTCIVKVDLKPGRTYETWLNSQEFQNFPDSCINHISGFLLHFWETAFNLPVD